MSPDKVSKKIIYRLYFLIARSMLVFPSPLTAVQYRATLAVDHISISRIIRAIFLGVKFSNVSKEYSHLSGAPLLRMLLISADDRDK